MTKPIVWTIAGSDSGGGAGIQADLHTFHSLGAYGCSVITAVTAQNSQHVNDIHYLPASAVAAQIATLKDDLPAKAIKLGMLGNDASIAAVLDFLAQYTGPVVFDPVLVATSGDSLFTGEISQRLTLLYSLMKRATLVTPNLQEAELLTNTSLRHPQDIIQAAQQLLALGAKTVLIKGGHSSDQLCQDFWSDGETSFWLSSPRQPQANYHGSGCTLASAITAALALGYDIKSAMVIAKMYVNQGMKLAQSYGQGPAPVAHHHWPLLSSHITDATSSRQGCRDPVHKDVKVSHLCVLDPDILAGTTCREQLSSFLPYLTSTALQSLPQSFPNCGPIPLGLYPIVDRAHWLEKLLPVGVTTIQLRIKDLTGAALEQEIKTAIALAKQYQARLFINDHWQLAIQHGAYGVHLGQEDLSSADMAAIDHARLRLGISTHSYYELARAHAIQPSYIAFGPIYPTTSKSMPFAPQGIEQLKQWHAMVDCPLVAIGGIDLLQLPDVMACGVDGVAVLSALTKASDPVKKAKEFLRPWERGRLARIV